MAATRQVVEAAGAKIDWIEALAGLGAVERHGDPLPALTLDLIRKHRVALKGPCTTPIGKVTVPSMCDCGRGWICTPVFGRCAPCLHQVAL